MDPLILTIVTRAFERLVVVLAGGLAIYLGFRLFLDMPQAERGSGKVSLPGGISIFLSRVGPGVFFSLFGSVVIGLSFHYGVSFSEGGGQPSAQVAPAQVAQAPAGTARSWSGVSPMPNAVEYEPTTDYERDRVVAVIAALNRMESILPADMKTTDRVNLRYALRDARVRLLISVWDPVAWGDAEKFREWVIGNEPEPAPDEVAVAAGFYRQGRPDGAP